MRFLSAPAGGGPQRTSTYVRTDAEEESQKAPPVGRRERCPVLPGSSRLRHSRAFERAFDTGATVKEQHVVLHVQDTADRAVPSLVGFAVSRRVGNAVVRNRVRRRLREIVRPELGRLRRGAEIVVAARASAARATFAELAESLRRALSKAGLVHA